MNKVIRAGYQGKYDAMRAMADRLNRRSGVDKGPKPPVSFTAADNEKIRPFKKGGRVKHMGSCSSDCKY